MILQLGQGGRGRIAVLAGGWRAVEQDLGSLCFPGFSLGSRELQTAKFKNFWGKFGTKLREQEAKEEGLELCCQVEF